jgi:NADH:ubiquinone oxidoreductase subunit E
MAIVGQNKISTQYLDFLQQEDLARHREQVDEILERFAPVRGGLIPALQQVQETLGFLPASVQDYMALKMKLPASDVFGVVSFYSFFTMKPRGQYIIKVCLGTACYVKGAGKLVETLERELGVKCGDTTEDRKYTVQGVRCLGACGLAPVVVVNEDTLAHVEASRIMRLLKKYE